MVKVLIKEDYAELRENTAEILEQLGNEVIVAEDGNIGVQIAFNESQNII